MNEEFTNASGDYLAFSDDGITCRNTVKNRFYPYGSIVKIGFSLGSFDIMGKTNGENKAFLYVATRDQKSRIKDLINFAKTKMRTAPKAEVVEIEPMKSKEEAAAAYRAHLEQKRAEEYKEIRMKCNICGHVFCYTKQDLKNNQTNATMAAISSVGSLAAAFGGTAYTMYEQNKIADRNASKVVDYSRCPSCRSTNLTQLSDDDVIAPTQTISAPASSPIEELKQYKELMDMGVITQEEFDAKKKQLLGL